MKQQSVGGNIMGIHGEYNGARSKKGPRYLDLYLFICLFIHVCTEMDQFLFLLLVTVLVVQLLV